GHRHTGAAGPAQPAPQWRQGRIPGAVLAPDAVGYPRVGERRAGIAGERSVADLLCGTTEEDSVSGSTPEHRGTPRTRPPGHRTSGPAGSPMAEAPAGRPGCGAFSRIPRWAGMAGTDGGRDGDSHGDGVRAGGAPGGRAGT